MKDGSADVVIIGSGIAGLMAAHILADEKNVIIITKSKMEASNSSRAQGGIAASIGFLDHWQKHFADTIQAGHNHHQYEHVEMITKLAPTIIEQLVNLGVPFDREKNGQLALGMEGAHSERRIAHAKGDQTGKMFTQTLLEKVKERVLIYENTSARELIKVNGKIVGVKTNKGTLYANAIIVATGGSGQLYEYTSNVAEATGDGFALAYRAGAKMADMEFIQFHPTLFMHKGTCLGLISEAVRGEGAVLLREDGSELMKEHPLKNLAPRDIVSRAIFHEYEKGKQVYLDCTHIMNIEQKFPSLYARYKLTNLEKMILQVVPGAHFISGGIITNEHGETSVEGLYAIGEVAYTGVHGANRLASNSLLEGLIFAKKAAAHIWQKEERPSLVLHEQPIQEYSQRFPQLNKIEIQKRMSRLVGIERNEKSLQEMERWLTPYFEQSLVVFADDEEDTIELKNMVITAMLITKAAKLRTESRGGHFRTDFIHKDKENWDKTLIVHTYEDRQNMKIDYMPIVSKEEELKVDESLTN